MTEVLLADEVSQLRQELRENEDRTGRFEALLARHKLEVAEYHMSMKAMQKEVAECARATANAQKECSRKIAACRRESTKHEHICESLEDITERQAATLGSE